ncbi:MAG: glucan biosynthesis protein, partial [Pirellulaceae bacterium]
GEGQVYGTSARGLAIDVGLPQPEEFPVFRRFWIEQPGAGDDTLRVAALLDGPQAVGVYQIRLQPGRKTVCQVEAAVFFRRVPAKVGLAPLTSMWMWGDGRTAPPGDPRPEVHDSDGLLVQDQNGVWMWRPHSRQPFPSLSRFHFSGVRGFGLLQRDRDAASYRDDEARYHARPHVWIEPAEGWGEGSIEVLELPAEHEGVDNIAAWWTSDQLPQPGKPLTFKYTVSFGADEPERPALARAVATRVHRKAGASLRVEIDFDGGTLPQMQGDSALRCDVQAQRGTVADVRVGREARGVWRVSFDIQPAGSEPVELHATVTHEGRALTETWRYLCPI